VEDAQQFRIEARLLQGGGGGFRTLASFISSGNTPVERERFTSLAMGAARTSASFLTRPVGIGSRVDDFAGQDLIKAAISSVVTPLKFMKLTVRRILVKDDLIGFPADAESRRSYW
jgi:hypothetical protein